jgi:plastocyanin
VRRRPASASAIIAVLALALAACGTQAPATPVATEHVNLPPSYLFSPAIITVKVGTTVTWTNHDNFTHSVRIPAQNGKVVGVMHPGQSVTYSFPAPGTYHYDCSFHPQNMKGTVVVTG